MDHRVVLEEHKKTINKNYDYGREKDNKKITPQISYILIRGCGTTRNLSKRN